MADAQNTENDEMADALNRALADCDTYELMGILGRMTRAHRMRRVAQETGLGEKSLYKSMRAGASPEVGTVIRVLRSLGFRLQVHPVVGSDQDDSQHRRTS